MGLDIAAGQVRPPGTNQAGDDGEGLLEPADLVIGRIAERLVFRIVPARADPEDQRPPLM